jgi:hypothetical protein
VPNFNFSAAEIFTFFFVLFIVMPKLRYKDEKKHSSSRHKSSKKKEKYYKPPTLYEEESGWVPPTSHHDDEAEWRAHLFHAMMDDEGQDPFYTQYQQPTPVDTMTDEEHRQYMMDGMYKRKNADKIAADEKKKEKKKREREKARKEEERHRAEQVRLENIYKQMEQVKKRESSRTQYLEKWTKLDGLTVIHKVDIPWPMVGKSFSLDAVRSFVVDPQLLPAENKKNVRKEQARYHPDKFITRYMKRFSGSEKEKESVITHINEISGWLNELWSQVNV